tara:strand:- start:5899 stop:6273 length:375 start_codon:yes stop_codon:yes gene_type:complete
MAAPNIVNVTSIYGKTVCEDNIGTGDAAFLTNAASSNKVLKINSLTIANIDGSNDDDITVTLKTVSGTVLAKLAHTVAVPKDTTLVVISKDTSIYLEEDMVLHLDATTASRLSAVCSYEELDDA